MTQTQTVTIHIMDKEYHVVCPVNERTNLERAAAYLDTRMREIRRSGKVVGAERIAVLAALNVTHDLQAKQQQLDELDSVAGEKIQRMTAQVDEVLAAED